MVSGIWITLVVPAIIAFLFALWVTISVFDDLPNRPWFTDNGQGGVKASIYPPTGPQSN